ncbi:MAG: hypothetical protein JO164_09215 [Candidatus Eremiobacteraeota bacterium]|nr:hypothetical protein [Candidatus Eremiobacteraeota bacterium]
MLGAVSGIDSLAGSVMPPIVTGVLGMFGVAPAAAIMVTLVVVALIMGLVQARGAGEPCANPVTATVSAE